MSKISAFFIFFLAISFLASVSASIACDTNCNYYGCNPADGKCTSCQTNYYNTSAGACALCSSALPGCSVCYYSSACASCSSGFYENSTSNTCVACSSIDSNCNTCSNSTGTPTCSACVSGFYKNPSNTCVACNSSIDNNCNACSNSTGTPTCTACVSGFYPNSISNTCVACSSINSNCNTCSNSTGTPSCTACASSYFVSGSGSSCALCNSTQTGCSTCSSTSNCTTCVSGFYLNSSSNSCVACSSLDSNCDACSNSTNTPTCTACSTTAYFLNSTTAKCATCASSLTGCLNCSNSSACTTCNATAGYWNDAVNHNCTNCALTYPGCTSCNASNGTCTGGCNANFVAKSDPHTGCMSCGTDCTTCSLLTASSTTCSACTNNKNLISGTCADCNATLHGCTLCDGKGGCTACSTGNLNTGAMGYIFNTGYTGGSACTVCNLPGCGVCDGMASCLSCNEGYAMNFIIKQCVVCPSNCYSCLSPSICNTCLSSFVLSADSTKCLSLSASIANCTTYSIDSNGITICTNCQDGYGIKNDDATKCMPCVVSNCDVCVVNVNNYPNCTKCYDGALFNSTSKQCQFCGDAMSNCQSCSTLTSCSACNNTNNNTLYLTSSGTCASCSSSLSNCVTCSAMGGVATCQTCASGYYLASGKCVACSLANCVQCSDATTCTSCAHGFNMITGTTSCTSCKQTGCNCSASLADCAYCVNGFIWDYGATCTKCATANCAQCTSTAEGSCTQCMSGFYLINTVCVVCNFTLTGCLACSDASTCTQCNSTANLMLLTDVSSASCVSSCTANTQVSMNGGCFTCMELFGCSNCIASGCVSGCPTATPYISLPSMQSCVVCIRSTDVQNDTSMTCNQKPTASVYVNVYAFVPTLYVSCGVDSMVFYAYGLYTSADNISLSTIQTMVGGTGLTYDYQVPTNDDLYWVGYGFLYSTVANSWANINSPVKNSGEQYEVMVYCVSKGGQLSSSVKATWTQPSNGANTTVLSFTTNQALSSSDKLTLGTAIKKTLKIKRSMYTDDKVIVPDPVSTRLLDSSNSTNTSSNASNNTFNNSFYIIPDYTLTADYTASIVRAAISNKATFLASLSSNLGSSSTFIISGVTQTVIFLEPFPTIQITSIRTNTTNLNLTLGITNTTGYIYVGIELTLPNKATDHRLLETMDTNSTNNTKSTNSTNSTSSNASIKIPYYNLTIPSIANLLSSKNADGAPLLIASQYVASGTTVNFTFGNLTARTCYNVYFVAANENFPAYYSNVYGIIANTTVANLFINQFNQLFGGKIRAFLSILILFILLL